jgi:tripartite-type tricarboxylate transporter receptor subunit TctC
MPLATRRAALAALAAPAAWPARAAALPGGPVTLVVPFTAGGTTDLLARAMAEHVAAATGQPVQVQNRAGGGSVPGTGAVAGAPGDGRMLLMTTAAVAMNPAIMPRMPFDTRASLASIMMVARNPLVVVVSAERPERSLAELLQRARGAQVNFASSGQGTPTHMGLELLAATAGVPIQHTPLRGSSEVARALGDGTVDGAVENPAPVMGLIRAGRLRALAVTSAARSPQLPEVPTLAEAGVPGIDLNNWFGLFAPASTPEPVRDAIHAAFLAAGRQPGLAERFGPEGVLVAPGARVEAQALFLRELETWARVARERGISAG